MTTRPESRFRWSAVWTAALLLLAGSPPAFATYPGANGSVAYEGILDVGTPEARFAIFVDGAPLTAPIPGESHSEPSWSADGSKLVYVSNSSLGYQIEKINSDG